MSVQQHNNNDHDSSCCTEHVKFKKIHTCCQQPASECVFCERIRDILKPQGFLCSFTLIQLTKSEYIGPIRSYEAFGRHHWHRVAHELNYSAYFLMNSHVTPPLAHFPLISSFEVQVLGKLFVSPTAAS